MTLNASVQLQPLIYFCISTTEGHSLDYICSMEVGNILLYIHVIIPLNVTLMKQQLNSKIYSNCNK